jgi:aldehyde dehydrogenase (NAD+)
MEVAMKVQSKQQVTALRESQQSYFKTHLRSYDAREKALLTLKEAIITYEDKIYKALRADLGKSDVEILTTEVAFVIQEINKTLKHLLKWIQPKRVRGWLLTFPSSNKIHYEPYGSTLIIAPWNYPFQLLLAPAVGAIAAGNSVVLKPSEFAPHTAQVIEEMIEDFFPEAQIAVVQGEIKETTWLLEEPFDYIFFTGSPRVGSIVMTQAAKHLTPLTLELGGKSPCIVDETAPLQATAKRILFGKTVNAGQTCIAPDYLVVHESIKDKLVQALKVELTSMYGPRYKEGYGKIIHQGHFDRLESLLEGCKVLIGAPRDAKKRIFPLHVVDAPKKNHPMHHEEIFGPILPIYTYNTKEEIVNLVSKEANPLALYLFSQNQAFRDDIVKTIPAGGVCINDTILHIVNPYLPFGGRGRSGHGAYHGATSFLTFSHQKSVMTRSFHFDIDQKYPPYSPSIFHTIKHLLMK